MHLSIETMLSLSEMYYDVFTNKKEILFLMQLIDEKKTAADKLNMHTYYLLSVCIFFLSITSKHIICVSNDTN